MTLARSSTSSCAFARPEDYLASLSGRWRNVSESAVTCDTPVNWAAKVPVHTRTASTGSCFSASQMAALALQLAVLSAPTGVASVFDLARTSQRLSQIPYYDAVSIPDISFRSRLRSIQSVLSISISELASILGVSRQAVYKWLSRGPMSDLNRGRLEELSEVAEYLSPFVTSVPIDLSKLHDASGLTLVEALRSGNSAKAWAEQISHLLNKETNHRKMLMKLLDSRRRGSPLGELGVPLLDEQDD